MNESVENKVKGIVGLYNFYKYEMNTLQRVSMLTVWIDLSIQREEYEVAAGLQKELDKILNGEEEFYVISPSDIIRENLKKESLNKKPVKKKLKFVNYWGSKTFELFRISFREFKFIIFNIGFEIK